MINSAHNSSIFIMETCKNVLRIWVCYVGVFGLIVMYKKMLALELNLSLSGLQFIVKNDKRNAILQ